MEDAYGDGNAAANKRFLEMYNHVHAGQETERGIMAFSPKSKTVFL